MDPRNATLLTQVNNLPNNIEAEKLILGAAILTPGLWASVREYLRPADFFLRSNQRIAQAFDALAGRGIAQPDPILLAEEIGIDLPSVGGPAYLASLIDGTPYFSNVQNYCEIVLEKSIMRQMMRISQDVLSDPEDADSDAQTTPYQRIEQIMQRLQMLRDRRPGMRWQRADLLIQAGLQSLNGPPRAQSTGWTSLDKILLGGGWLPGRVYIVAARTNVGKSSFGMSTFSNMHRANTDAVTGYISLEQTQQSLSLRLLGINAEVPYNEMQTMRQSMFSPSTMQRVWEFEQEVAGWNYEFQYNPRIQPHELLHECASLKRKNGGRLDGVFVDYPALIQDDSAKPYESRTRQLRAISAKLKEIAGELDVPVIVPVQVNRQGAAATRTDEPLQLDHLAESDAWGQDPDVVILINRTKLEPADGSVYHCLIDVAKQRDGMTGKCMLDFRRNCGKYQASTLQRIPANIDADLTTVINASLPSAADTRARYLGEGE